MRLTIMSTTETLSQLADQPVLDIVAEPLSKAVRDVYAAAGRAGQQAKNVIHGVWLGHPMHPVFTDLPLGAWTTGSCWMPSARPRTIAACSGPVTSRSRSAWQAPPLQQSPD